MPEQLERLPDDPFSGKPLVYRLTDEGFRLYSVGPNGVDDGGKSLEDGDAKTTTCGSGRPDRRGLNSASSEHTTVCLGTNGAFSLRPRRCIVSPKGFNNIAQGCGAAAPWVRGREERQTPRGFGGPARLASHRAPRCNGISRRQETHHRRISFQEALRARLKKHAIEFDDGTFGIDPGLPRTARTLSGLNGDGGRDPG